MKITILLAVIALVALVEIEAGKAKRGVWRRCWRPKCFIRRCKKTNRALNDEIKELREINNELLKNATKLTELLASKDGQIAECNTNLQGAQSKIAVLETELNQTREKLEECQEEEEECTDITELVDFTVELDSTERSEGDSVQIKCGIHTVPFTATCTRVSEDSLDWTGQDWGGVTFSTSEELKSILTSECVSIVA